MQFLQDMPDNPFLITGLLAGLLASVSCGIIGPYVVARRIVFLSGAIAHMALGGIGGAVFLANAFPASFSWLHPLHGAVVAALCGAVIIGLIHGRAAERTDTLIGALWAIGMALGILLIKFTPGYQGELMGYLFGNITSVSWDEVSIVFVLDILVVGCMVLYYKRLLAICLDEQQAQLQGVHLVAINILLLSLVALTVMCLIQIVGLILVIALLTLPAATAGHHLNRMAPIIAASILLCALLTTVPRVAVYGTRVSPESAIVLAAGAVYLSSMLVRAVRARRM